MCYLQCRNNSIFSKTRGPWRTTVAAKKNERQDGEKSNETRRRGPRHLGNAIRSAVGTHLHRLSCARLTLVSHPFLRRRFSKHARVCVSSARATIVVRGVGWTTASHCAALAAAVAATADRWVGGTDARAHTHARRVLFASGARRVSAVGDARSAPPRYGGHCFRHSRYERGPCSDDEDCCGRSVRPHLSTRDAETKTRYDDDDDGLMASGSGGEDGISLTHLSDS